MRSVYFRTAIPIPVSPHPSPQCHHLSQLFCLRSVDLHIRRISRAHSFSCQHPQLCHFRHHLYLRFRSQSSLSDDVVCIHPARVVAAAVIVAVSRRRDCVIECASVVHGGCESSCIRACLGPELYEWIRCCEWYLLTAARGHRDLELLPHRSPEISTSLSYLCVPSFCPTLDMRS